MNFLRNTGESGEFYHLDPRNGHIWFCSIAMQGLIQCRKTKEFCERKSLFSPHLLWSLTCSLTCVKEPEEVVSAHCVTPSRKTFPPMWASKSKERNLCHVVPWISNKWNDLYISKYSYSISQILKAGLLFLYRLVFKFTLVKKQLWPFKNSFSSRFNIENLI